MQGFWCFEAEKRRTHSDGENCFPVCPCCHDSSQAVLRRINNILSYWRHFRFRIISGLIISGGWDSLRLTSPSLFVGLVWLLLGLPLDLLKLKCGVCCLFPDSVCVLVININSPVLFRSRPNRPSKGRFRGTTSSLGRNFLVQAAMIQVRLR
jgi:hypothetical protein